MAIQYNPNTIQTYAEALYSKASGVVFLYTVMGILILGGLGWLFIGSWFSGVFYEGKWFSGYQVGMAVGSFLGGFIKVVV